MSQAGIFLHIYNDYCAILDYMLNCLNSNAQYYSFAGEFPFYCLVVNEGYNYLKKNGIIDEKIIEKKQLRTINKCRSTSLKLYENFQKKTFDSINEFNRESYEIFFKLSFPYAEPILNPEIKNYFLAFKDNCPIGNYHLYSKKNFHMDIGRHNQNVSDEIRDFSYTLTSFITKIIMAINPTLKKDSFGNKRIKMDFNDADLNMAYDYKNFSIKGNPPILMAFLDILCVLNNYRKVFIEIANDTIFKLKMGYIVLFYSIVSIKSILGYCTGNNIVLPDNNDLVYHIETIDDEGFLKNDLRKDCMHYNDSIDSIIEKFEMIFNMPIEKAYENILIDIDNLGNTLQKYLIVFNF